MAMPPCEKRRLPFEDLTQGTMEVGTIGTYYNLQGDLIKQLWVMKRSNFA